jgi:hypothetical protein
MYQWISDDLDSARARGKRWLFVFMHHPPYSRGTHDSDSEGDMIEIHDNLVPLFESKGVDMVLVGHSHVYERSFLARNDSVMQTNTSDYTKIGTPNGTLYLVSGCGGKTGDGDLDHPLMAVSKGDVAGFNIIDVTYEELRGSFVERDGRTTDLFTVRKAADVLPPRVAHVQASSSTEIQVVFDEPVRAGASGSGAGNLAHYDLQGSAVIGATLESDQRTVSLTTMALPAGRARQLTVQGVADSAGNVDVAGRTMGVVHSGGSTSPSGIPVVPRGSIWRYVKGTSGPSPVWSSPSLDDSAWPQGRAGFGFSDGDDATVLSDMQGAYPSVYLRARFTVLDPAAVTSLALNVNYDDGFVAHLNGVEVARDNVPAGQTSATLASGGHEAGTWETFDLGAFRSRLVPGSNVLAIEGHNSAIDNQDFSLHPELVLTVSTSGSGPGTPPVAVLGCAVREANVPAQVFFSGKGSYDPDGNILGYAWSFGDGTFGFGSQIKHVYDRVGTYTVTLLARDRQGMDAIDQQTIRIHALGQAPVARVSASNTSILAGGRVDFDSAGSFDPDGGTLHVQWDFGEPDLPGNASTLARTSRMFPVRGTYPVLLSVTDDEGSTTTQVVMIRVN